ncbi:helix-turn-helix transcriptional regulator [Thermicanus aegyptius]|uniref:helix-turn-helix transcriptional regulator n=1 Tax=Thermicanus aegyptius TaxID=94009 RepID=UPI0004023F9A|nr:AraC family transcriptional regulator [Thermicanus aegyptius]
MDVQKTNEKILKKFFEGWMENQLNFYSHPSYRLEKQLVHAISLGNWEEAKETLDEINRMDRAILAKDPLRSLKNSLICSCTLFTRAIIQGGVDPENAYNLSDVFIRQIEETRDRKDLEELEYEMLYSFINRVREEKKVTYQWVVSRALEYIHDQILSNLTLKEIAAHIEVHPSYLSKVFHAEVGISLIEYVNRKKIEASQYFLLHSNSSISEIAQLFGYCNQSYYTLLFKRYIGLTPKQYRNGASASSSPINAF